MPTETDPELRTPQQDITEQPAGDNGFVSLYRRFRPGRFSELRGQPHVVRALQSAVRDGHVAHAYLFSGPRGTGKTSTARILARALNCTDPRDGEPCGVCPSCTEIARGTSLDVHELDAASNNGVDAMRDLIAHAALGTPGRWKVYIVDEVHMLSNAAANALLKTLEEPPSHVIFVLATTDPQKVPPTIRSRTQHFEFRLLGADTLHQLLSDIRDEAGLGIGDDALTLAVRRGRGSARDALSALDQVAAAGTVDEARPELDEILWGLCEEDPARVLVGIAALHEAGWGPQQLASDLVDELRQAFLVALAPELAQAEGEEQERLTTLAERVGLPRVVRAMEVLGQAQVDMREAPDPRVVLEVALVRLAQADLDDSGAALADRLSRLERAVFDRQGSSHAPPAAPRPTAAPAPASHADAPAPRAKAAAAGAPGVATDTDTDPDPATTAEAPLAAPPDPATRPGLGALRRKRAEADVPPGRSAARVSAEPTRAATDDEGSATGEPDPVQTSDDPAAPSTNAPPPDRDAVVEAWGDHILRGLPARAKALYSAGRFLAVDGGTATFALPNAAHRDRCLEVAPSVEQAMSSHFGAPLTLHLVVDDGSVAAPPESRAAAGTPSPTVAAPSGRRSAAGPDGPSGPTAEELEQYDPEIFEAEAGDTAAVESAAQARLLEAFPGAEEVTG